MNPHRLRAPSADGGLLAEPPLSQAAAALAENARRIARHDHDFQGRRFSSLQPVVRKQAFDKARVYLGNAGLDLPAALDSPANPLIVTGHQPELFHPGVWVKNFAAAAIAGPAGASVLNLVIDNDIPKGAAIRVPYSDSDGTLKVKRVPFDEWRGEVPYEDLKVVDESVFASFADRVRETLGGEVADPIIDEFWPRAMSFRGQTDRPAVRFALARRGLEAAWGIHNLEVPLSAVCETEGFLWFASHLLANLARYQEIHNDALGRYRQLYGIRSKNHPVAALGSEGDWLEAPFWVWRDREPRRRPLLVRQHARTMELRIAGEDRALAELPLAADREACCAVDELMTLPAKGVRLRTRALTTTMFARFLLGDLFVHGIGGAKYDELGDEISARFFGLASPTYLTASMTLWLGLKDAPASPQQLAAIDRNLRDLTYRPDRFLESSASIPAEAAGAIAARAAAVAGPVATHAQRLERFHEIRRCNEALRPFVAAEWERVQGERRRVEAGVKHNGLTHQREYSLVLHSARKLRAAMSQSLAGEP